MAKSRRVIRTVQRAEVAGFDDQLWPINLALLVLGGFVAGIIIVKGGFDDPRLLYNGWARLATLAITLGAMFWGVTRFDRKVGRRVQLAALISLLLHLGIAVFLTGRYLELARQQEQERERLMQPQEIETINEYALQDPDLPAPEQEFEKPVEVEVPETKVAAPTREVTTPKQAEALQQPTTVPAVETELEPSPVEAQRQQTAAPRRAASPSKLSKQTNAATSQASAAAEAPRQQTASRPSASAVAAPTTPLERQQSEVKVARQTPVAQPQTTVEQEQPRPLNRVERSDPAAHPTSTPTLKRAVAEATQVPRAAAPQEVAAQSTQETAPTEPQPRPSIVERTQAAAPQLQRQETEPALETSVQVQQADAARQQPSETQPTLAAVATPAVNRRPVEANPAARPVEAPSPEATESPAQAALQATTVEVARTATATPSRTQQQQPSTAAPAAQTAAAPQTLERRAASDASAPAATAASAQLQRSATAATATASAAANVAQSSAPAQQESAQPGPAATSVARSQTAGPQGARPSSEPQPAGPSQQLSTTGTLRQASADQAPSLARAERPAPARQTVDTAAAGDAAMEAQSVASNQPDAPASPGPRSSEVARAASQSPALSNWQPRASDGPPSQVTASAAQAAASRAASSQQASLTPSASAESTPRRAAEPSAVASSPVNVESPAIASASSQDRPTARPSSAALSRAEAGFTGRGRSQNTDVAMAADPRHSAPVASAAARRPEPSQEQPGSALSPSAPPRIVRSIAGAETPSATVPAQQVESADVAGARQPSELVASASAAVERQDANAPARNVTAAAGHVEVDTGTTQVVPDVGTGRGDGGGQPEIAVNPPNQRPARARAGGGALAAITSDVVEPMPAAPEASGGGSPAGPQASTLADAGGAKASVELTRTAQAAGDLPAAAGSGSQHAVAPAVARASAGGGGAESAGQNVPAAGEGMKLARTAPAGGAAAAASAAELPEQAAAGGAPSAAGAPALADSATSAATAGLARTTPAALPGAAEAVPSAGAASGADSSAQAVSPTVARANVAEALPGTQAGGGTSQPQRNQGREVAMVTPAAAATIDALPQQGGAPEGQPLAGEPAGAAPAASGLPTKASTLPTGAVAGPIAVDTPVAGSAGAGPIVAQAARGTAGAPAVGSVAESGAPLKQGAAAVPLAAAGAEIDEPLMALASAAGSAGNLAGDGLEDASDAPARIAATLPVHIRAEAGPGGLEARFTPDAGITGRRAQRDSEVVKKEPGKYLQKVVSGAPVISGTARSAAEPFAKRGMRQRDPGTGGEGRPSMKTEVAIERGIEFLIRHQSPDGSWSLQDFGQGRRGYEQERAAIRSDTAATGLALLALLGAGYDHYDDKYKDNVAGGIAWLLKYQKPDGDLYVPQDRESNKTAQLYSHGIAALALCEAYGMTGDPELGAAAQKALDFIVESQHPQRGGWRYTPGYSSDLSVSGWQLMALKSGELAGLTVPAKTYELVIDYLERSRGPGGDDSKYVYNPHAPDTDATRHGRRPSTAMTSVGLLMRMYTGWNRDHEAMRRGADHLLANLPAYGNSAGPVERRYGTINNPQRDTYYWYYATQVMFHMKGEYWEQWNQRLHPLLTESQIQTGIFAGSWDPRHPIPDTWGPQGGRIYVTAMNLLSLEVYYRHLPIYESTAQ